MSIGFLDPVDIGAKIATILAFGFTTGTFWLLYFKRKKSEQYSIANDITKSLTESEHKILETPDGNVQQKILRHKQYLNVWEWFALMVNNGELKNENILEHFKPLFLSDYKQYSDSNLFPELKDNNKDDFRQIRKLHKKWTNPS
jgi:hypothetical protein